MPWFFLIGVLACRPAEEQVEAPLTVMTFNVLCSFCNLAEFDPWAERLEAFADIFERHDPDLLGLQELAAAGEVDDIAALLPSHETLFFDDGVTAYPDAAVLYRRDRFEVLETGSYWLSPTPEEPFSTGFTDEGGVIPRLVVWAHLDDSLGGELYFATTHFENTPPSQEHSAVLATERMQVWESLPIVFSGDLNAKVSDPAYAVLAEGFVDTWEAATERLVEHNSATEPAYDASTRIDHIFVGGAAEWTVEDWTVDLWVYGAEDRLPSDHRAVVATLR